METVRTEIYIAKEEAIARQRWNESADRFNQWEELGGDEKAQLVNAVHQELNQGQAANVASAV